jgi:hypothetical protein
MLEENQLKLEDKENQIYIEQKSFFCLGFVKKHMGRFKRCSTKEGLVNTIKASGTFVLFHQYQVYC